MSVKVVLRLVGYLPWLAGLAGWLSVAGWLPVAGWLHYLSELMQEASPATASQLSRGDNRKWDSR